MNPRLFFFPPTRCLMLAVPPSCCHMLEKSENNKWNIFTPSVMLIPASLHVYDKSYYACCSERREQPAGSQFCERLSNCLILQM